MKETIKILCVDDEENVIKSLERLFLDTDYKILSATSGEEGLEILKNNDQVQLVISDYRMPKMNGVDFLKEVYSLRPDTVRIVLSGYADTVSIVEAINEGQIYKFIPKPWNDDELKVAIANALERYFMKKKNLQLTRELEGKNRELREINNNLERLVEERTNDLLLQNRILTCSQNILDALPVGVLGIDPEGLVVQCNERGHELLNISERNIYGTDRLDILPKEVNELVERALKEGSVTSSLDGDGNSIKVKGVHMKHGSGQEGIILVFDEKDAEMSLNVKRGGN